MMKMNKKGFTIVELVIVIAVIAILAAVMSPTFSGIVTKAQTSAELQKVTAAFKEAYAVDLADGAIDATTDEKATTAINGYSFVFTVNANNQITAVKVITTESTGYTYGWANNSITVTK